MRNHRASLLAAATFLVLIAFSALPLAAQPPPAHGPRQISATRAQDPDPSAARTVAPDQVLVIGGVLRPQALNHSDSLTVLRAVAMAGGTLPGAQTQRVRILRRGGGVVKEIIVDLKGIGVGRAEDVALEGGDIVYVPGRNRPSGVPRELRDPVRLINPSWATHELVTPDAAPNKGMQRTRNEQAFYHQSSVRAADAWR